MGVVLKNSPEWLYNGTALYYALSLDQMVKPFGGWLLNFPVLLKYLTFGTLAVEFIAPILFIIPYKNAICKFIGLLLLISLHVGIELTLHVGLFSFICISALIGLLPAPYINIIETKVYRLFNHSPAISSNNFEYLGVLQSKMIGILGASFVAYILIWNLNTIPSTPELIPTKAKFPANVLRLDQRWGMFAPRVTKTDGWYIFEALLDNGKYVDLFNNKDIRDLDYSNNKPDYLFKHYKNARWRKYLEGVLKRSSEEEYENIGLVFINSWLEFNDHEIVGFRLIYNHEYSLPAGYSTSSNKHILYIKDLNSNL